MKIFVTLGFACIFYLLNQILIVRNDTSASVFSTVSPRTIHIGKSDESTTFIWSTASLVDNCTVNLGSDDYIVETYFKYAYDFYFYKLIVPNSISEKLDSYSIECTSNNQKIKKHFSVDLKESKNKLLLFGDFSTSKIGDSSNNQHTLKYKPNILKILEKDYKLVDSIWHLGDFAYDLFSNRGTRGLEFLSDIESVASHLPYIPVAGNHELRNNFHDFQAFFSSPLFFIRTIGPCKIFAINSEFDFFYMKPWMFPYKHAFLTYLKQKQLKWLKKELKSIDRETYPFVVVVAHKPLYCSKNQLSSMIMAVCELQASVMRETFEKILVNKKVDLGIFAHIHLYERTLPVKYQETIGEYKQKEFFVNPPAPIYVINGVAGNLESENIIFSVTDTPDPWTVTIKENLGYGVLTVHNKTHIQYEQFGFGESQWDDAFADNYHTKHLDDSFWIVKTNQ